CDWLAVASVKLPVPMNHEDAVVAEAEKPFFFSSGMTLSEEAPQKATDIAKDSELFAASDFAKLSEPEANERLAQSMYWAGESDRKAAKKLTALESKQRFLFGFWRGEDEKM